MTIRVGCFVLGLAGAAYAGCDAPTPRVPEAGDASLEATRATTVSHQDLQRTASADTFASLFEFDRPEDPPPAPVMALSASLRVRDAPRMRDEEGEIDVRFPSVQLPDEAARRDLEHSIRRAVLRVASGGGGFEYARGRCRATLATAELVSVLCELTTASAHDSPARHRVESITFRLGGPGGAQYISPALAFVDLARVERAICAKTLRRVPTQEDNCLSVVIALAPDRVVGRWIDFSGVRTRIRSADVPYAELASLIRRDGILGFAAAPANTHPSVARTITLQAASPEPCRAFGPPVAPGAIGATLLRARDITGHLFALESSPGLFRPVAPYPSDLSARVVERLVAEFGPSETVACSGRSIALRRFRLQNATIVFSAPGGGERGQLRHDEFAVRFDRSRRGGNHIYASPGRWSYVVGSSMSGWVHATTIDDGP